jgi:hypothetical protein
VKTREATKKYRLNKWAAIISECRSSGQNVAVWCADHDIKVSSYYYWLRLVREAACEALPALTAESNSIVPVDLSKGITPVPTGQISQSDIVLRVGSAVLEISNNASAKLIESTLKAIQNVR